MAERVITLDPGFGWWVTGLADGEGCFYAGLNFRQKPTSSGRVVSCVELQAEFVVALRADDVETLNKLQAFFGCGYIKHKHVDPSSPSRKHLKNPKPQKAFLVRNPRELVGVVIPHFRRFQLQSKKARDFDIWSRIVEFAVAELVGTKGWLRRNPDKVEKLRVLCSDLREVRAFPSVDAAAIGGVR